MKSMLGTLALVLIPGALMAQGKGRSAERPNVPMAPNVQAEKGHHDTDPPAITKGDQTRSARAGERAHDIEARREAGSDDRSMDKRDDDRKTPAHKRKHHKGKGHRKP